MLGDRLIGAKLIIDALGRDEIDQDQAERLLDSVVPASVSSEVSRSRPNATEYLEADDLARVDAEERREAENAAKPIPDDVEAELARLTPHPIEPVQPGENLLDDPEAFKQRVRLQQQRKLEQGTPHR